MAYIAVLGHGVVGSGVVELARRNVDGITRRAGEAIEVKHVLDLRDFPDAPYKELFTKDFGGIVADPEVSVVVEAMGGLSPAYEYTKQALSAGKSVVTSNKELVATHGAELLALARNSGVQYMFEASVGGGIPIIRPMTQCLAANELNEVTGILNGTTNYILTQMISKGRSFDDALARAQEKGYAESDPTADVDGIDACRKISILASLAFGRQVDPLKVHTEGIRGVSLVDVGYAGVWGGAIKLLGRAVRMGDGGLYILVAPFFIDGEHPLSSVEGVYNGIVVRGDAIGEVMFYGKGAGKLPTASAIMGDVIDAVKHRGTPGPIWWTQSDGGFIVDADDVECPWYVRGDVFDRTQAKMLARRYFGHIREVLDPERDADELAFITQPVSARKLEELCGELTEQRAFAYIRSKIRVLQ